MKFSSRTDIAAPIEFVFDQLADFAGFERAALRRGVELKRLDTLAQPGPGMSWDIGFRMRGKRRQIITDIRRYDRPKLLEYAGASTSFEMLLELQLTQVAPGRTRLQAGFEVKPRTLAGRLMVQSAKIGRKRLERKYAERIATFGREIERRAAGGQA
jgi:hypothetical protein